MKRVFLLAAFAFSSLFILSGSGTEAFNMSLGEKFAAGGAVQTGDPGTYSFDKAHSFIGFKVKHMGLIEVPGFFRDFTGSVNYDAKDVTRSTVEFAAKATSVDTGVSGRDTHLRTADFFEVEKYPEITFKSTKVEKKGNGWMVTGDFTMKGVTKSISFPFNVTGFLPADQRSGGKMGITGETTINRRDYGVNYGSNMPNGTAVLSDEVKINLQIEANKAKEAPKAAAPAE
ncbi:MAG: YceI family protein [Saprospiraceae bacterium]|nr:YceI family protein [Pyrinomonadaceae bacterium]